MFSIANKVGCKSVMRSSIGNARGGGVNGEGNRGLGGRSFKGIRMVKSNVRKGMMSFYLKYKNILSGWKII